MIYDGMAIEHHLLTREQFEVIQRQFSRGRISLDIAVRPHGLLIIRPGMIKIIVDPFGRCWEEGKLHAGKIEI